MTRSIHIVLVAAMVVLTGAQCAAAAPYVPPYSHTCVITYGARTGYTNTCANNGTTATASSVIITPVVMRAALNQTTGMIADHLARFTAGQANGAGQSLFDKQSADKRFSAWASVGNQTFNTDGALDAGGHLTTWMAGADYRVSENLLGGVALAYEDIDVDTSFNLGNYRSKGVTISPYAAYKFDDHFSVDAAAGYSRLNVDMNRNLGLVTSSSDADRWFGIANGNYDTTIDRVHLSGKIGYLYAVQSQDGFTESDGTRYGTKDYRLAQLRAGGQLGYRFDYVEPFVMARYDYNLLQSTTPGQDDRGGLVAGLGANFALPGSVQGSIAGEHEFGRNDYSAWALRGSLRVPF